MTLDPAAQHTLATHGFLVRPRALSRAACETINARLSDLILRVAAEHARGDRASLDFWPLLRRSTQGAEVFLSPTAGSPSALPPEAWERATMRVGHALHRADPHLDALCRSAPIAAPLAAVVPSPAVIVQTALIYKQPQSDIVQFGFHQDSWYLTADPETLALAFLVLDDMDEENGCLQVIPGSHREGLAARLQLTDNGFQPMGRRDLPAPPHPERARSLPAEQGTLILVHGRTWHASGPNRSPRPRRALLVHAMNASSRLHPSSWIQPPPDGFTPLIPVRRTGTSA